MMTNGLFSLIFAAGLAIGASLMAGALGDTFMMVWMLVPGLLLWGFLLNAVRKSNGGEE